MINFYNGFVNCKPGTRTSLENVIGNGFNLILNQFDKTFCLNFILIYFLEHIDYVKNKIGIDYVGIGGDFDGVDE